MNSVCKCEDEGRRSFLQKMFIGMVGASSLHAVSRSEALAVNNSNAPAEQYKPARLVVSHVDKFKVVVPLRQGISCSPEYADDGLMTFWQISKCIIKVFGDNGLFGVGETNRGYSEQGLDRNIKFLSGRDIFSLDFSHPNLELPDGGTGAAFEMAIYDLIGKNWGVPAWQLLGGKHQDKVSITYWTGRRTAPDMENVARKCNEMEYTSLKFKGRPGDDIVGQFRSIAKVSPDIEITVDFNQYYKRPEEVMPILRQLDGFNVKAIEDPFTHNLDSYARVREELKSPIAMTFGSQKEILNAIKAGACDCFNINGNMRGFIKNCIVADAAGMTAWHGSGVEVGAQDVAYVHSIAATPNCTIASDVLGYLLREDDLLSKSFSVSKGFAIVSAEPGLGIELDEDAVKKYQV